MATLNFGNAYQVYTATTPASKEQNSVDIIFTPLGATQINDGSGSYLFSGNDVSVISIIIGGTTYYGWISRPVKSGGDVKGFYFWTDADFTSLADATADGNQDGDNNDADNLGFILVVDQAWFDGLDWEDEGLNLKNVKTSSDGVDDDLNALLPPQPPGTPVVTITEDADNDGVISGSELAGNVNVSIALPADAVAGDTLVVSDGTTTQNFVLTNGQINAGVVTTTFAPPAQGATITVTAHVTNQSNVSGNQGSDSALLDIAGPGAPTVTITEDANDDGVLAGGELVGDVNVSVALPGDAVAGDELTVTDGTTTQTFVLTAGQILAGVVATTFAAPAPGATITVTAYVTDQNGNQGASDDDAATRDTSGPAAPVVTITEDANNNGVITAAELSGDVDVSVALPDDAVAGDTLTVTDGTTTQNFVLTAGQILAGTVTTSFAPPPPGGGITVTAYVTDQNSNQGASGQDAAVRENSAPLATTVVITEDANNDAVISALELSGDVDVLVSLPANAVAGDTLTVDDGITTQTFILTQAQVDAGQVTTTFAPPPHGGSITVSAYVTDQQGNDGPTGADYAMRDTVGPFAPVVVITEDANNNAVLSQGELVGDVDVSVTLPEDAVAGDVLSVSDGTTVRTFVLTSLQIAAGTVTTTFTPPEPGGTITVTAWVTDERGNEGSQGSDSATRMTAPPAPPAPAPTTVPFYPTVLITEDINNNGVIGGNELIGEVNVLIALPYNAVVGDVLTVDEGGTSWNLTLAPEHVAVGWVTAAVAPPPDGGTVTVTAYVTNRAGQQGGSGSDSAVRDTTAPGMPQVVIAEDANNDGQLTAGELSGSVDVSVTLGAGVVAGDVLNVYDGITMQTIVLTAQQVAAGAVTASVAPPPPSGSVVVYAALTDAHGNRSAVGFDSVGRGPDPVYSVLLANGDRVYTASAHDAALMAQGTGNVLEGARFDSLAPGQGMAQQMYAFYRPASGDWYFAADGTVAAQYGYQLVKAAFMAGPPATGVGDTYDLWVNGEGITQLVTQAEADALGLAALGYQNWGAQFDTSAASAFRFDAEGYLVANQNNAGVRALVQTLAGQFSSTSAAGFIDAVEQDFLARVQLTGTPHGGAATAADVNAAFGTAFGA